MPDRTEGAAPGRIASGELPPAPEHVPYTYLEQAEEFARKNNHDPTKVKDFLASRGHHMDDAWCADFVAAVVKRHGGTPVKDYPVADAWKKYGSRDTEPHKGDIATKIHQGGHGHVGFVEDVNKDKTFTMLGGNQGPGSTWRINRRTKDWEFRRPPEPYGAEYERINRPIPEPEKISKPGVQQIQRPLGAFHLPKNTPSEPDATRTVHPTSDITTQSAKQDNQMLFVHGMENVYGKGDKAKVEEAAEKIAKVHGYSGAHTISSNKQADVAKALEDKNITGVVGFSRGGNQVRRILQDPHTSPETKQRLREATLLGSPETSKLGDIPGVKTRDIPYIGGVGHMQMVQHHAETEARRHALVSIQNRTLGAKTEAINKAGLKSAESAPSIQEHHHHYQTTATTHSGPESTKSAIAQLHTTLHHASKSNPRTWVDN